MENGFATQQLKKFCKSVNALAYNTARQSPDALEMSTGGQHTHRTTLENVQLPQPCTATSLSYAPYIPMNVSLSASNPFIINQFAEAEGLGSEWQAPAQQQTLPRLGTQSLPTLFFSEWVRNGVDGENRASPLRIMNGNLAGDQDVTNSTASRISQQAYTSLTTIAPARQTTRASMLPRSPHMSIAPVQNMEEGQAKLASLTFSIVSSAYLTQLRTNILALRTGTSRSLRLPPKTDDVAQIFEELEKAEATHSFRSRLLLLQLVSVRDRITREVQLKKTSGVLLEHGSRKVEAQVLDILVERIYNITKRDTRSVQLRNWRKEFKIERKKIQKKLWAARIWKVLIKEFGLGILILVPWSGQNGSLNDKYQSTKDAEQRELCCLLRQGNGVIQEAADQLTPFIESILAGHQPPRLLIECEDTVPTSIDRSVVTSLLKESCTA